MLYLTVDNVHKQVDLNDDSDVTSESGSEDEEKEAIKMQI